MHNNLDLLFSLIHTTCLPISMCFVLSHTIVNMIENRDRPRRHFWLAWLFCSQIYINIKEWKFLSFTHHLKHATSIITAQHWQNLAEGKFPSPVCQQQIKEHERDCLLSFFHFESAQINELLLKWGLSVVELDCYPQTIGPHASYDTFTLIVKPFDNEKA
ncbi:hypothetical protein ACJX0J_019529, partial [Zea mays]